MISLYRYKLLLRETQVGGAIGASIVGRLPIGMAVLAILLFVQQADASFTRAGIAAALYITGVGLVSPLVGRLIDRFGPRPVLFIGAAAYPLALGALIVAVKNGAGPAWVGGAAFFAGMALPPVSTCMRALLRRLLHDPAHLQAAYSLDSVLMETVFIIGPGLVSLFAAAGLPSGAVACAAVCACAGALLFARSTTVRAWVPDRTHSSGPGTGALATKGLRPILGVTLFFSIGFGLFEVSVTAVAAAAGAPAAAGLILALASVGSAAGALLYGSRSWPLTVAGHYKLALIAMAAGLFALAPVENVYAFGVLSVFAGVPMSTVLAAQSVLIAGIAARGTLAESFTWSATSLLAGVSLGIAAGGLMLEQFSPTIALLAAGASTTIALGLALIAVRARPG